MSPCDCTMPKGGLTVNIYVDDSNISIGGRRHRYGSPTWDYDPNILGLVITHGLPNVGINPYVRKTFSFYGTNLRNPAITKLRGLPHIVTSDSTRNGQGKEKQADTQLTADMTEQVIYTYEGRQSAYFIVLSGDADMIPAVKKAVNYGFSVHVWSWKRSLSPQIIELAGLPAYSELVEIHLLDPWLQVIALR
ncbi:hypothetical protein NW768_001069 [Fusarium equiseti]|uniref:NYN domain-containing protein n=1 Tax=Fusarium equiseti TaxID=61235 RepID=A0ABQ8RP62_FUSEQ|nr:hypothetical protein NW768_001069 [Fusarium equiseti]